MGQCIKQKTKHETGKMKLSELMKLTTTINKILQAVCNEKKSEFVTRNEKQEHYQSYLRSSCCSVLLPVIILCDWNNVRLEKYQDFKLF